MSAGCYITGRLVVAPCPIRISSLGIPISGIEHALFDDGGAESSDKQTLNLWYRSSGFL